ncbi:MAG: hypothetical protein DRI89_02645 [Bacteroidetes bacterium]|nr:MAG: hypothetical protein DRI89_02645 [Bacteroidota bacterium]
MLILQVGYDFLFDCKDPRSERRTREGFNIWDIIWEQVLPAYWPGGKNAPGGIVSSIVCHKYLLFL